MCIQYIYSIYVCIYRMCIQCIYSIYTGCAFSIYTVYMCIWMCIQYIYSIYVCIYRIYVCIYRMCIQHFQYVCTVYTVCAVSIYSIYVSIWDVHSVYTHILYVYSRFQADYNWSPTCPAGVCVCVCVCDMCETSQADTSLSPQRDGPVNKAGRRQDRVCGRTDGQEFCLPPLCLEPRADMTVI